MAALDVRCSSEGYQDLGLALDLRASLLAAEATVRSAIERRESRGSQQRSDYPALDPALRLNFVSRLDSAGNLTVDQAPIAPIPAPLRSWINEEETVAVHGRLLE
jgi:succinate dehydrogenase / fumarate reductase flavoprotein subunit